MTLLDWILSEFRPGNAMRIWLLLIGIALTVLLMLFGVFYAAGKGDEAIARRRMGLVERRRRGFEVRLDTGDSPVPQEETKSD